MTLTLIEMIPLQSPESAALSSAELPLKSKLNLTLRQLSLTYRHFPHMLLSSHPRCCHNIQRDVTEGPGMLLNIHAFNRNFPNRLQEYLCLALVSSSALALWRELSLKECWLSGTAPFCLSGSPPCIHKADQRNAAGVLHGPLLLPLDHSYRSALLTSLSSSAQQGLPTQAPIQVLYLYLLKILHVLA